MLKRISEAFKRIAAAWRFHKDLKKNRLCYSCALKLKADPTQIDYNYYAYAGYCRECHQKTFVANPSEFGLE